MANYCPEGVFCPHGPRATGVMFGGECDCDFRFAIPSPYRAELAEWIWVNVPATPGIFLLHFHAPIGDSGRGKAPAQHYLGWSADCRAELLSLLDGHDRETKFSHIVNVANAKGVKWHPSKIWTAPTSKEAQMVYDKMKGNGAFGRKCPECR